MADNGDKSELFLSISKFLVFLSFGGLMSLSKLLLTKLLKYFLICAKGTEQMMICHNFDHANAF
jgi:hypothetical protein